MFDRIRGGRGLAGVAVVAALVIGSGGMAVAGISDGNYRPERMHCSPNAEDYSTPDHVEPGCHNLSFVIGDGAGNEALRIGTQQQPDGEFISAEDLTVETGDADFTTGARLFFGADDNLFVGEHDGSNAIGNGPSDGGAIVFNVDPATLDMWMAALQMADVPYVLTHPLPLVDAGIGMCADGICLSIQTERRVAYEGGDPEKHRSAADYEGKEWDPATCAGPSDDEASCGPGGIATWHEKEGTVYTDPGAQVYEDPDPQGSPLEPYPLPAVYVGSCGVIAGGGAAEPVPASPLTNGAGQLDIPTGCG